MTMRMKKREKSRKFKILSVKALKWIIISSSYRVSPRSSWCSNLTLYCYHLWWRRCPLCCFCLWQSAGGSRTRQKYLRSRRSSCPSRLSRPHRWFWQSRISRSRYYHTSMRRHQSGWIPASISSHCPLELSLSSQSCWDMYQGSLARRQYPRCHSLLLGKVSLLAARVWLQLLNRGHKQGWAKMNTDRSSSARQL